MRNPVGVSARFVSRSGMFFLNENTSVLDSGASLYMHVFIEEIHPQKGKTVIHCTRQPDEAKHLCNYLIIRIQF